MPREPLASPPEKGTHQSQDVAHEWRSLRLRRLFAEREFDELLAAYIMNDADLWRTVSQQSKRHEGISWGGVGCLDHSVSAAKASLLAEPTTPSLRRVSRRD